MRSRCWATIFAAIVVFDLTSWGTAIEVDKITVVTGERWRVKFQAIPAYFSAYTIDRCIVVDADALSVDWWKFILQGNIAKHANLLTVRANQRSHTPFDAHTYSIHQSLPVETDADSVNRVSLEFQGVTTQADTFVVGISCSADTAFHLNADSADLITQNALALTGIKFILCWAFRAGGVGALNTIRKHISTTLTVTRPWREHQTSTAGQTVTAIVAIQTPADGVRAQFTLLVAIDVVAWGAGGAVKFVGSGVGAAVEAVGKDWGAEITLVYWVEVVIIGAGGAVGERGAREAGREAGIAGVGTGVEVSCSSACVWFDADAIVAEPGAFPISSWPRHKRQPFPHNHDIGGSAVKHHISYWWSYNCSSKRHLVQSEQAVLLKPAPIRVFEIIRYSEIGLGCQLLSQQKSGSVGIWVQLYRSLSVRVAEISQGSLVNKNNSVYNPPAYLCVGKTSFGLE